MCQAEALRAKVSAYILRDGSTDCQLGSLVATLPEGTSNEQHQVKVWANLDSLAKPSNITLP